MSTRNILIWLVPVAIVALLSLALIPRLRGPEQVPAPAYWPTQGWRSNTPEEQGFDSAKLAEGVQAIRQQDFNIHSLLIIRNGFVVVDAYFYPYDGQTVHDLASVTKSVMTTLIAIAADQDKSLDERLEAMSRALNEWQEDAKTWTTAIGEFNQATLRTFLDTHPDWAPRLALPTLGKLSLAGRRQRLLALLNELVPFVERKPSRVAIARRLVQAIDTLDALTYRADIRIAALLRIRFVYTRAAGHRLAEDKPARAKTALALEACEDLQLPTSGTSPPPGVRRIISSR